MVQFKTHLANVRLNASKALSNQSNSSATSASEQTTSGFVAASNNEMSTVTSERIPSAFVNPNNVVPTKKSLKRK